MKKIKEYFSNKRSEQIFSLSLLVGVVTLMLFCAIVRICGGLWFLADTSNIEEPTRFWRETIMGMLLAFELTFVYKILCRRKWQTCVLIAICQTLIGILIGYLIRNLDSNTRTIITNIYNMFCMLIIPIIFTKKWFTLLETVILYIICTIYSLLFLVGRIGDISVSSCNFIINVISIVDYKLFVVALYLIINYFGGIKLWKRQRRMLFATKM